MENPVVFAFTGPDGLDDFSIASSGTQTGTMIDDLAGIDSLAIYALMSVGGASTGATVRLFIQTSFAGAPFFDIACIAFDDVTEAKAISLTAEPLTTPATLGDGVLTDDTVLNGPIGDRVRAKVVTDGDYTGPSLLSVRGHAR